MCCTREVVVECYDDTTERMENDSSNERMSKGTEGVELYLRLLA